MRIFSVAIMAALLVVVLGCERKPQPAAPATSTAPAAAKQVAPGPSIKITRWGPEATPVGKPFNVQPNGLSAIWFELTASAAPTGMEGWFGETRLTEISVTQAGGALLVPTDLLKKPGRVPVYLVHTQSKQKYEIGMFDVMPGEKDAPVLAMKKWGPAVATVGEAFNKQPSGLSAIWFEFSGALHPGTMEAWFGDQRVKEASFVSNVGGNMAIPTSMLNKAGKVPVYLIHGPTKTRYDVGVLEISPK
jgi:hypothetical protein